MLFHRDLRWMLRQYPGESFFEFAEVAWSNDEEVVGVLVDGTMGRVMLASGVSTGQPVDFEVVRPLMEAELRKNYRVPRDASDAIKWVREMDALNQFRARYAAGAYR